MVNLLIALGFALGIACMVLGWAMEVQRRNPGYIAPREVWDEEIRKAREERDEP